VIQRRVEAPGKIRRLSIAVLLDQTIGTTQQEALKNAFAAAAGLDMAPVADGGRGDRIELLPMKFDRTAETEANRAADTAVKHGFQTELVRNGAAVLIVVLVLVASLLVGRRLLAARPEPFDALLADAPAPAVAGAGTYSGPAGAGRTGLDEPGRDPRASGSKAELVRQLAQERPDEVARQLQSWMSES
jgi:flagellar M-ring protein FliF